MVLDWEKTVPLRVIQEFYREEDGTRVWTNYRMEMKV